MDTLSLKLPLHRTNGSRTERRITTDISTINRDSNSEGRPEPVCPLSCLPFETWFQRHTDANGHRRQVYNHITKACGEAGNQNYSKRHELFYFLLF